VTDYERLESFFANREWFDYTGLNYRDSCHRKGFFAKVFTTDQGTGLDTRVGPGANFGTCFHAGLAAYYAGWGRLDEQSRRHMAIRTFAQQYAEFDFSNARGFVPTNHTLQRGLDILDAYCSQYIDEDSMLKPIEAELGFAVEIAPEAGEDDFKPFLFVGSLDGVFDRSYDNKRLPRETKTTGSGAEQRLRQLNFDRQPVGYVTCLRMFPECSNVDTFIGDVVLIAAQKMEFARDYFTTNELQRRSWRRQTILKVERWRAMVAAAQGKTINEQLDIFDQNTSDCFDYGKCPFYDLCDFGVSREALSEFGANTWNPLLKRPPKKTMVMAEGQIDSITLQR
jgi:PD-(D/E)XK nuclease superfamily